MGWLQGPRFKAWSPPIILPSFFPHSLIHQQIFSRFPWVLQRELRTDCACMALTFWLGGWAWAWSKKQTVTKWESGWTNRINSDSNKIQLTDVIISTWMGKERHLRWQWPGKFSQRGCHFNRNTNVWNGCPHKASFSKKWGYAIKLGREWCDFWNGRMRSLANTLPGKGQ